MARRRSSRIRRESPDRAWWFDNGVVVLNKPNSPGSYTQGTGVLFFEDINSDNVLLAGEKPDWYIKRVIFDAILDSTLSGTTANAPWRSVMVGLATMEIQNHELIQNVQTTYPIMGDEYHELATRVLRQWRSPCYRYMVPIQDSVANGAAIRTAVAITTPRTVMTPYFGIQRIVDDFEVSNANIREQAGLYIDVTQDSDGGPDWENTERISVYYTLRVLLQKRRT